MSSDLAKFIFGSVPRRLLISFDYSSFTAFEARSYISSLGTDTDAFEVPFAVARKVRRGMFLEACEFAWHSLLPGEAGSVIYLRRFVSVE
jgi:hypothetical protein